MGLGVLDDRCGLAQVPGTVALADIDHLYTEGDRSPRLKRGTGKDKDVILAPQPSNNPNDPLNWPYRKKFVILLVMVLGACLNASTVGPLLSASIVVLAGEFNRPITDITLLTGYNMVVAGASCPLTSALATKYGKRPVFFASSVACLVGSIIGSTSQSYNALLAARIIQGPGFAAYESLTFSVVGDLFFVHQRGALQMSLHYGPSCAQVGYLSAGPFIGGVIGTILVAKTTDRLVVWMATRNKGVYEPEFRLPLVLFSFLCTGGLCGFGALAQAQGNLYVIDFMWGLTLAGICFCVGPCSSYAIDAFREMSNEIFVANVMVKNFLFYGYSYFINDWITAHGAATPLYVFGGVSAALIISTLPVYIFGKRYRSFWQTHNIMEKLGIHGHVEI
ncbi:hypothetical protein VN97_g10022 [Penicillium thymicola]|uniref:Major facilitator superfamily (MFS) profile domain-containing protein n=1 Tax=Penicillium thymicola TaxID=293382 RepID=A0AAI9TAJ9_PENTH|nr:hypothetical protein VN97_g10022 [Penicillium thymicola]